MKQKQYSLFPEAGTQAGRARQDSAGLLPPPSRKELLVVPWQREFLSALLDQALADCGGDLSRAVFIFPHSRPEKYFTRLLRLDARVELPLILPRFHTIGGLFSMLSRHISGLAAWDAGLLDRVGLLLECVRAETADAGLFQALPGIDPARRGAAVLDDARQFFPWGVRLAALFEECFTQARIPKDFQYVEDQVTPFAARLLERLSGIFSRYSAGLSAREWTTPGRDASLVADHLAGNGSLPPFLQPGSVLYIAGFHSLTRTEDALFRHLWQDHGARIILHADPKLADGSGHWCCEPLAEWARRWQTPLEILPGYEDTGKDGLEKDGTEKNGASPFGPRIRYIEGFDLHSQLTSLQEALRKNSPALTADEEADGEADAGVYEKAGSEADGKAPATPDTGVAGRSLEGDEMPPREHAADTAVILPDTGLLMPVLHHLPHVDINVSMGYPLARSPLFRLIDTILRLQENRRDQGYYWRDLVELVRHPYLKMLSLPGSIQDEEEALQSGHTSPSMPPNGRDERSFRFTEAATSLRQELGRFEQTLRGSAVNYPDPFAVLEDARMLHGNNAPQEIGALAERVLRVALTAFEQPTTPRAMGEALEGLCSMLLGNGRPLWDRFLIDAECLYRLMQSVIPELTHSALAVEEFTPSTLFALVRQLLDAERVPFDATPLVGLQVMGVLESRLLSFRRVFLVDATEDRLPGSPAGDPLLPESLRPELGLPGPHSREQVSAYHVFRLLAGAEEAVLLWQEAPDAPGVQDGKKKKSRFVEELLWNEEKRLGRLIKGNDGPLEVLAASVSPLPVREAGIAVSPAIRELVDTLLQGPVSASLLDSYIRCPLRFFYERVARIAPAEEIAEGEDPLTVGTLLHNALQEYYTPLTGLALPSGDSLSPGQFSRRHQELLDSFTAQKEFSRLRQSLAADSLAMLQTAGEERLEQYLRQQPATRVLALETVMRSTFSLTGREIALTGTADRIDLRDSLADSAADDASGSGSGNMRNGASGRDRDLADSGAMDGGTDGAPRFSLHILDYKTGRPAIPSGKLWNDEALWHKLEAWTPGRASPLEELSSGLGSIQLPLYLYLFTSSWEQDRLPRELVQAVALHAGLPGKAQEGLPGKAQSIPAGLGINAAWVPLGMGGKETPLFKTDIDLGEIDFIIRERVPALLHFLLRHMAESTHFSPCPGAHCRWCFCQNSCSVRVAS